MAFIPHEGLVENRKYTLIILLGILVGILMLLAFISLPLKGTIALVIGVGFFPILMVVSTIKRFLIFILVLLIPLYFGTGLPEFLARTGQVGEVGLSLSIDLQLIDVVVIALLLHRLALLATHQAEMRLCFFTTVPALAWLFASALSAANASDVGLSVIQLGHMFKLFLLYIAVANSVEDEGDFNWLVAGLMVGTLFEGLLGPYQEITGKAIGMSLVQASTDQGMVSRVSGTLGHPNSYAMYLSATVSFALALLFARINWLSKVLISIVISVAVLGIILSLSRGGWLGLASVFLLVLGFALRRKRQSLRNASIMGFVGLLILLSLVFGHRRLMETRLTHNDQGAALSRITMAEGALAIIKNHPLLGVGLNNYALLMPALDPASLSAVGHPAPVHNIFLLIAAETGLVGFAAFSWLLANLFVYARRLAVRAPSATVWVAGVGAFSSFAALSLHGMVDYAMLSNMPLFRLFWLFAGVVAGLSTKVGHNQVGVRPKRWMNLR